MSHWHYWIIVGVVCFVVEIFTPGFVVASFGVACLGAAVAAGLGLGLNGQLAVFVIATLVVFVGIRPFVMQFLGDSGAGFVSGVDALIGREARVTEAIDSAGRTGRVQVGGENWRASTRSGESIEMDSVVVVEAVEGATLIVRIP